MKQKPDSKTVIVLGAGIVGVSCALALQARGFTVTLIDRRDPGEETSFGNAGVLARSSLIPMNSPALLRALPSLLKNKGAGFRYDAPYLRRNLSWALRFAANARVKKFHETTHALDRLIVESIATHRAWLTEMGELHRLRDTGWTQLYRSAATFENAAWARAIYDDFAVRHSVLDQAEIAARLPHIRPDAFVRVVHVHDAWSVDDPGAVVQAYAKHFRARGGSFARAEIHSLTRAENGRWHAKSTFGADCSAQHVVVAFGPWSSAFLAPLKLKIPMAFERGYHQHFLPTASLPAPMYDVDGGFVLTPTAHGLRLTTGVELNALDAPSNFSQLDRARAIASRDFPLGAPTAQPIWRGARPTLPDARPLIGASKNHANLWFAFGHQHIGFSTGPATGTQLARLMAGEPNETQDFSPRRFGL